MPGQGGACIGTVHVRTTVSRKSRDRDSGVVCTRDPAHLSPPPPPPPHPGPSRGVTHTAVPNVASRARWGCTQATCPQHTHTYTYTHPRCTHLCIYTHAPQMNIHVPIHTITYTCLKCIHTCAHTCSLCIDEVEVSDGLAGRPCQVADGAVVSTGTRTCRPR